ncbi:unnamed protein product [Mucor hiemalis]
MFDMNNNPFTSYQGIQSNGQKEALFSKFFNWKKIQRIIKEQKLKPSFLIRFSNQYDLRLYVKKPAPQEQEGSSEETRQKELSTKVSQSEVMSLNEKSRSTEMSMYRQLVAKLKIEEANRMDLGREFRTEEKKEKIWDAALYRQLKSKRNNCNEIDDKMQELNKRIKRNQCQMYLMNKSRAGQEVKVDENKFAASTELLSKIRKGNVLVQGIDPGIVTTTSVNCMTSSTLFNSINRFQCLEDGETKLAHQHGEEDLNFFRYDVTARRVNQIVLSTHHRLQKERKQKLPECIAKKRLEKKAIQCSNIFKREKKKAR